MIADRIVWSLARLVVLPVLYLYPLRMRRFGVEHLPRTGPVLIVCNHVSVADPIVLMAAARKRRTSMIAKRELFQKHPVFGWILRSLRAIPLDRSKPADFTCIRRACALLDQGDAVVVFPEGHVSRRGTMRRGAPGAGMFGLRPGVTVVPAVAWNTQLFRGPARVRFGPPIDLSDIAAPSRHERNRLATDRIMAALAGLLPSVGGPVQDPPVGPQRQIDRTRGIWFPPPDHDPDADAETEAVAAGS
ncbi:MAG TPA: lysophospholipid acyltransferase family protein [Miltoncostaeaceae bacterium]|nr:lysophospholipid acyltransferase family protein [Miltoncostaeaceae bacterium]